MVKLNIIGVSACTMWEKSLKDVSHFLLQKPRDTVMPADFTT